MAKLEPDRARLRASLDLPTDKIDEMWDEIVSNYSPGLREASEAWEALGEKYRGLGHITSD